MMQPRRGDLAGFSMVEVAVVIVIILIVSAMALLQVQRLLPAMRANAAMDQVVSQMRIARETAIARRRSVVVQFAAPNQIQFQVQLARGGLDPAIPGTPVVFEGGAQFVVFPQVPDTPSQFGNNGAIVFGGVIGGPPLMQFLSDGRFADPVGQPLNGTVFVGIPNQPATARAVTVLGATGRVRPYHWNSGAWVE